MDFWIVKLSSAAGSSGGTSPERSQTLPSESKKEAEHNNSFLEQIVSGPFVWEVYKKESVSPQAISMEDALFKK